MTDHPAPITVAALYRFVHLDDFAELRAPLLHRMQALDIKGTFLLAPEGINGTVAGTSTAIDALLSYLKTAAVWNNRLAELEVKLSFTAIPPFARCKVKLKNEIVTMGITGLDPATSAGTYVHPRDWNALISDPDVLLIDTRNDYEVRIGTFRGAVNPQISTFREFPDFAQRELDPAQHRKVAMFCTGGIRCEKSTAWLKSQGFKAVYHLQGGILKYLEEVPPQESLWDGECFVFDERVAVDQALAPGSHAQCRACRMPLSPADMESPQYIPGESCPHCHAHTTAEKRNRWREREKQVQLAEARGETHIGGAAGQISLERRARKLEMKNRQRQNG